MEAKKIFLPILTLAIFSNINCFNEEDFKKARNGGENISLNNANLSNANSEEYNLIKVRLPKADLSKTDLKYSDMREANLNGAILYAAKAHGANFSGASLKNALLMNANLNQTILNGTDFSGANLTDTDFSNKDQRSIYERTKNFLRYINCFNTHRAAPKYSPEYTKYLKTKFENVTATNAKFINVILVDASFKGANLNGAKFCNSLLVHADFSDVKSLKETDFTGSVLFGANFEGTNLEGAIVKDVDFFGVILSEEQKEYLKEHGALNVGKTKTSGQQDMRNYFKRTQDKQKEVQKTFEEDMIKDGNERLEKEKPEEGKNKNS